MANPTRLPAFPLITHDPYFSLWSFSDKPYHDAVRHWSGAMKTLNVSLTVDGKVRRLLGHSGKEPFFCRDVQVTPLSTLYVYEDLGVAVKLRFTSPLLPDDLDVLSTPVTYLEFSVSFTDGQKHRVKLQAEAHEKIVYSGENTPRMRMDFFSDEVLHYGYIGQMRQMPLSGSGDQITQDWGYLFLAAADAPIVPRPEMSAVTVNYVRESDETFDSTLLIGYDDIASINYFGRMLPGYWARDGKTITQAMRDFHERKDEILGRCRAFDRRLLREAERLGGRDYALVVTAAYRQSVAAHKLVADRNGDLLFISKENDSNGCAATTDVSYPSVPLYLLYCPELVRAMCRPILKFASMPVWRFDYAPHDAGRYPVLNGQIYGARLRPQNHSDGNTVAPYYLYPDSVDAYDPDKQMPLEESANMILMLAAACRADGCYAICRDNLGLLRRWCRYLIEYGEDPGEQLCTDDFAGHLAHNVNLSAKAVMGVAAFGQILKALGQPDAEEYAERARIMGASWLKRADAGDHSSLTFDGQGWSQKYNLVWDKLLGFGILPEDFYRKELSSYLPHVNRYGLPLDSRAPCSKSDWTAWVAAMTDDKEIFRKLIRPIARYLRESESRIPFSDFYDSRTGHYERFIARSVQGGVFMPLLMNKWKKK